MSTWASRRGTRQCGVASGSRPICRRSLALSANSPFWHGRPTGHHAHRIEVLEGFPTGGLPPRLASWAEYLDLVDQLRRAGFIESHRDLWWDIRPNAENGTIEVRILDMPPDLPSVLGLTGADSVPPSPIWPRTAGAGIHANAGPGVDHPPESLEGVPIRSRRGARRAGHAGTCARSGGGRAAGRSSSSGR